MDTWLLKWNPDRWSWDSLEQDVAECRRKGFFEDSWTCGNTKRIRKGDRVFLLAVGIPFKGLVGDGEVVKEPYLDKPYDGSTHGKLMLYVGVRFYNLLNPKQDTILVTERLDAPDLAEGPWHVQGNGKSIPSQTAATLERIWASFLKDQGQRPVSIPEEIPTPSRYLEGATRQIAVNAYERNSFARKLCIEHHGCRCAACGFDFEATYGEMGLGFIHVHHLKPLSEVRKEYEVNPISDLIPVCPNCHAMIHCGKEMMNVEALKGLIRKHAPPFKV